MNYKAILIVAVVAALAGTAKAVKDTVSHHYAQSVFSKLKNEQYWNPAQSWKNKYQNYEMGNTRARFVLATTWLVSLTDAWHLFDMLHRVLIIAAGISAGLSAGNKVGFGTRYWLEAWLWFLFVMIAGSVGFHTCYTYLFV